MTEQPDRPAEETPDTATAPTQADTPLPGQTGPSPAKKWGRGCLLGCSGATLAMVVLVGAFIAWRVHVHREKVRAEDAAREAAKQEELVKFDKVVDKLQPPPVPEEKPYDLDKTMRVVFSIDQALKSKQDFDTFLASVMSTDTRNVAPGILEEQAKIFRALRELYAKQESLEAKQSLLRYAQEFFVTTLSLFSVDVSPASFEFGSDKESAKQALEDLKNKYGEIESLQAAIQEDQNALFDAMYGYAQSYYKYLAEWDKLCLYRDRAYLASAEGNWPKAIEAAREAIALAPMETEAHLLLARALIEQGGETSTREAGTLLHTYVAEHPDRSAPALLLLGVLNARGGDRDEALLQFSQAAAYYPKQSEVLSDMLNPYKQRAFLRKSREGNYILSQYKGMMLGAGYFSPDLQTARIYYGEQQRQSADQKVLDHFSRRRAQNQWDFVLSDIDFCYDFLGTPFQEIYPESSYLDLVVKPGTFGSKLKVSVKNRSDKTLHNCSLILCLHLTDMITGDYIALQAGKTQPAVLANAVTDFGEVEVKQDLFGMQKTVDDIVATRAILVSQEAVVWVDTEVYRVAEAQEFREKRKRGQEPPTLDIDWVKKLQDDPKALLGGMLKDVKISKVENRWGKDAVQVSLPKELAILRPIFRLMVDGQTLAPEQNQIEEDRITLTFDKVAEFSEDGTPDLELILNSPFTDVLLKWLATQQQGGYKLEDVEER